MSLDSQAAELELFFLRAVLPEEIEVAREPVILTGPREAVREDNVERQLNFGEAIKYLVAQPKPIRCRGRLSRGRFSLDTSSATVEQLQFHNWALSVPSGKLWERAGASSTDLLQVKSGKEAAVVSFEAFEIWQRDYVRSGSTVIMGPSVIHDADPDSPKWQVGVGYAGPPAKSYSLHEDERVLCDRCRQQLAVAAFRDHSTMPVQTVLLCGDCLRAEAGRELGRAMGIEEKLSDEQAHKLIDSSFRSLQDDLSGHREDAHE